MATKSNLQLVSWVSDPVRKVSELKACYTGLGLAAPVPATKAALIAPILAHLAAQPPAVRAAYQPAVVPVPVPPVPAPLPAPAPAPRPRPVRTPLTIGNTVLNPAQENTAYSHSFTVAGGNPANAKVWSLTPAGGALPAWLSIANGQLSCTPPKGSAGTYNFNVVCSEGANSTTQAVTLTVNRDPWHMPAWLIPAALIAVAVLLLGFLAWYFGPSILANRPTASVPVAQTPTAIVVPPAVVPPAVVPPANTAVPTPTGNPQISKIGDPNGMKYQNDAGCAATNSPYEYPACILQNLQSNEDVYGGNVVKAVQAIQALGAKYQASSFEDVNLTIPNKQAALVWCPAGVLDQGGKYAPDIAFPLKNTKGNQWTYNLFIVSAATGGPDRIITSADPAQKCWMVYVH